MAYQKSLTTNNTIATSSVCSKEHNGHRYEYERNKTLSLPWFILTIFLAAVSMLCKEQGIVSLGLCLAYDWLVVCRINFSSIEASLVHISLVYRGKLDSKSRWASSVVRCVPCYYLVLYFNFSTGNLLLGYSHLSNAHSHWYCVQEPFSSFVFSSLGEVPHHLLILITLPRFHHTP